MLNQYVITTLTNQYDIMTLTIKCIADIMSTPANMFAQVW